MQNFHQITNFVEISNFSNPKIIHDYFNIFCLPIIIFLNLINISFSITELEIKWNGTYFLLFWYTTFTYFIIDYLWVFFIPKSVKSPELIKTHHIITILNILCPYYYQEAEWFMGVCMIVELNTWFLIVKRQYIPFHNDKYLLNKLIYFTINTLFYLSWYIIRLFIYPILTFDMYDLYISQYKFLSNHNKLYNDKIFLIINPFLYSLLCHFCLCLLNLKWTFDLVKSNFIKSTNNKYL